MNLAMTKPIGKSRYRYVRKVVRDGKVLWMAQMAIRHLGLVWTCYRDDERKAAIEVDRKLIELGREPINILKRLAS